MLNEKTITGMVQMILQHCSEVIDDTSWSISKFHNSGDDSISNRLMPILEVLSQYCILSLPLYQATDLLMRCLIKVYKTLGTMAKFLSSKKQKRLNLPFIQ